MDHLSFLSAELGRIRFVLLVGNDHGRGGDHRHPAENVREKGYPHPFGDDHARLCRAHDRHVDHVRSGFASALESGIHQHHDFIEQSGARHAVRNCVRGLAAVRFSRSRCAAGPCDHRRHRFRGCIPDGPRDRCGGRARPCFSLLLEPTRTDSGPRSFI